MIRATFTCMLVVIAAVQIAANPSTKQGEAEIVDEFDFEGRFTRQTSGGKSVPASCKSKLSDFGYPTTCPAYAPGTLFSTFMQSACSSFCKDKCIVPFLKYMDDCQVDKTDVLRYCGETTSSMSCCTLVSSPEGREAFNTFFTSCNGSNSCNSSCKTIYDKYDCCLASLDAIITGGTSNGWSSCGNTGECTYLKFPDLPLLAVPAIIGIVVGVVGSILLSIAVIICICCACGCLCGGAGGFLMSRA